MDKDNGARKRKTHTKSRQGCKNCKLRRVKCDETKPQCQKCLAYGVSCDFDGDDGAELQLPGEGAFSFTAQPQATTPAVPKDSLSPEPIDDFLDGMLGQAFKLHQSDEKYHLTEKDIEMLRFFKDKTVFTIGTAQTVHIYRREVMTMSLRGSSYLVHIVLALALMHYRYVSEPLGSRPSSMETFHLYHGTGLFNAMLSHPALPDEERDPLWACAALLGCISIASFEATSPEEAWPLKAPDADDLVWLKMGEGKKEVWRIVDPLREGSVFKAAFDYQNKYDPEPYTGPIPELQLLYPYLTKIYDYDPLAPQNEEQAQDPYHTAASIVTRLLELECNHSTIMYFLSFLGHMDPRYRQLLHDKDPKAMLLLSWWCGKMCQYSVWWQTRRMRVEGQAICMYLERNCADQDDIMRLLDFPKMMTGLVAAG